MSVLVTNAHYRNTLATIRSLHKRKIPLIVTSSKPTAISFYSKYGKHRYLYQNPLKNSEAFIKSLLAILKKTKPGVLFPVGVDTTVPISFYKSKFLPLVKVPIADYDVLVKAHDKSKTVKIAEETGIPIPKTYFPNSFQEVDELSAQLQYPAVIKRRKGSGVGKGVRIATSKTDLLAKYREIESYSGDSLIEEQTKPLIQEYVPGEIRDVCVLFNQGKPRAALTQRRVWTWPPEGGPGIINETIDDPSLQQLALKLLKKIKWHGLAQVEFKLDEKNQPKLMEINPKFWGTLELSIKAGLNFPSLLYDLAMNGDVEPCYSYQNQLTILWLFPYNMQYLSHAPNRLRNLRQFLKLFFSRRTVTDCSLRDIKPEFVKVMTTFVGSQ